MSVDNNRGLTIGLRRAIASPLSVMVASFLYHPVEEIKTYL